VPAWLSEEWLEDLTALADSRPPVPGVTATVSVAITTGRSSQVSYHWRYVDGVPGEGALGAADDADLTLLISSEDAGTVMSGEVSPSVAYMRGRLKPSGEGGLVLAWLASTTTDEYRKWRSHADSVLGSGSSPRQPRS
jgi:SCP-2 sterol transfer family